MLIYMDPNKGISFQFTHRSIAIPFNARFIISIIIEVGTMYRISMYPSYHVLIQYQCITILSICIITNPYDNF